MNERKAVLLFREASAKISYNLKDVLLFWKVGSKIGYKILVQTMKALDSFYHVVSFLNVYGPNVISSFGFYKLHHFLWRPFIGDNGFSKNFSKIRIFVAGKADYVALLALKFYQI